MCEHQVVDLSAMIEDERRAFLARCSGEVCVSYKYRPAIAAAAIAAAAIAVPSAAAAQTAGTTDAASFDDIVIIMGGIKDPSNTELEENPDDAPLPELPIVYEDGLSEPSD